MNAFLALVESAPTSALNQLITSSVESQTRKILRTACPDPEQWPRLEMLLESTANLPAWFSQIDDSSFSLTDWIEALLAFDDWLVEKDIAARPIENMIGYIHCCTLTMAETLSPPNLAILTREMLDQHGFDAASEVRTD